ncbi:MAG: hypothetical protein COS42_01580 [Flavobacteriales bacterium CG03_land_8_20_14_0_80_35_15]|nr:hypothetical protein [Flavobacteriia bacterium]PIV18660.1 MAG: hypothetical protein COS42_01580 [Flavobacteriales bacterium CG03_land_8_20_14_0_80_35_15]PJA06671.1 MAG: hypothetical protein COX71_01430 [Flavobacteriales bacterium CG_4_10_14_0_2_um_filter_35_18]
MSDDKKKNQIDVFKSVKSEALNELTPEILETGFDLLIESEVLKEIPVFGIGFKSFSLYNKITESFFTKKLLRFLFELKDIPQSKREEFITELESKNETKKAGEKLLITLNRLNDDDKASIIGKLLKKTILGNITFNDFKRLTHIIDNTYLEDLELLKDNEYLRNINDDIKTNLHQIGLLNRSIKDNREHEEYKFKKTGRREIIPATFEYKLNSYGRILIENGFD